MDVYEAINKRKSIRKFKPDIIDEEVVRRVMKAGRMAPSAENIQPWKYILVKDEDTKRKVVVFCNDQRFIAEAPIILIAVANVDEADAVIGGYLPSYPIDVATSMSFIMLAAAAEGLGTCWIGDFKEERLAEVLDVPDSHRIVGVMPLGYPAEEPEPSGRKPLGMMTCYDRFED